MVKPKKTGVKGDVAPQTRQEIEEALSLFECTADANGFQVQNLKVMLRALGFEPRKDDIQAMVDELKPDEKGIVAREAVINVVSAKMNEKDSQDEILRAFRLFDDDETGNITVANLKRVARELGETITDDELNSMIAEADTTGTGQVSQEDFLTIMKKTCLY